MRGSTSPHELEAQAKLRRQNGHRGSQRRSAMATAMRMVTSESAKCRSGRAMERVVGVRFSALSLRGGKSSRLFGNEKREAEEDDRDVVVPATVRASFEMVAAKLALEVLVRPLGPPSFLQRPNDALAGHGARQCCEAVLRRHVLIRPFDDQPLLGPRATIG